MAGAIQTRSSRQYASHHMKMMQKYKIV